MKQAYGDILERENKKMRVIRKLKYGNKADLAFDSLNYILMFGVLVIVLYPLIYVVSASFSDPYKVSSRRNVATSKRFYFWKGISVYSTTAKFG